MIRHETDTVTCPQGHTFGRDQLSVRDGQFVCPVCDGTQWATPRAGAPWSSAAMRAPIAVLVVSLVLTFAETVCTLGVGAAYAGDHIGGSNWLVVGSAVTFVGIALSVGGLVRIGLELGSRQWRRSTLVAPLAVVAAGQAVVCAGALLAIGLNAAFVSGNTVAAGWQLTDQIFSALAAGALAAAIGMAAASLRRPDPR